MPNEITPRSKSDSEYNNKTAYRIAHAIKRSIEKQLSASGKHPLNREKLFAMRGMEASKTEARNKMGIKEHFCLRKENKDGSTIYKLGYKVLLRNGTRAEALVVSTSAKEPLAKHIFSFTGANSNREIVILNKNNMRAIQRARRMLKLPVL